MAAYFYEKAALKDYIAAQYNLGLCFVKGIGVTKNLKQAYFWMLLASAKEDVNAMRIRNELENLITPEERIQAENEARNWMPG